MKRTLPDEFSRRLNLPYLLGVYLLVNAVEDLFLLVDGPDCILHKAEFIHGKHDWNSTLLDAAGAHRIVFSNVTLNDVAADQSGRLEALLDLIRSVPGCGGVLASAMPVCAVTGFPYERLLKPAAGAGGKPVMVLPSESLSGDWLDGYAAALAALAGALPLKERGRGGRAAGSAAVVGLLADRNEGDHRGNRSELRRLLAALGMPRVGFWPGEGGLAELSRAAQADLVISLPYGREAARVLAERTGARLVRADLPFGLDGTEAFLRCVARAAGRPALADTLVRGERARVFAALEWVLPYAFLNRELSLFLDPHLAAGMLGFCRELGLRPRFAAAAGSRGHAAGEAALRRAAPELTFEPRRASLEAALREPGELVVGGTFAVTDEALREGTAAVELGFPSWHTHFLTETPFLGFEGALSLAQRMANALSAARVRRRP
ncbi:MAG: hypothetical protein A2X36_16675 [Elusimicrobia bacterium GWA2_69_24]|nr:MAG: hypothetical protein A2X36_16675 [Elusimicrobia bacterium GWA2_69_24]HBL16649.1 hypothetical protein [Elusimicrobiota bacterium]